MLSILVNILLFVLVIGVLTFIHEFGHFVVAKLIGATVYEFALGFGPKLLKKKYKGTEYSIRLLPLGGFVKIAGDGDPSAISGKGEVEKDSGNLQSKPKILQIAVMLAGVTMNILFTIIIYYIVLGSMGWKIPLDYNYESFKPTLATMQREGVASVEYKEVVKDGNASKAGIPVSGKISKIGGVDIKYSDQVGKELSKYKDGSTKIEICNESCSTYDVNVTSAGTIGIILATNYYIYMSYENTKLVAGPAHLVNTLRLIGQKFGELFKEAKDTGDYTEISNSVSGPVGIYFLIDYFKNFGVITFLSIMADLSLSLAVMNILPIPALDGGRVLILFVESVVRKNLDERIKNIIINGSFILLMILVIFILVKDILNVESIKNMFN